MALPSKQLPHLYEVEKTVRLSRNGVGYTIVSDFQRHLLNGKYGLQLSDVTIITYVTTEMELNTNLFVYDRHARKAMSEEFGLHRDTIKQSLAKLVRIKVMIRLSKGKYRVNPFIYWRGSKKMFEDVAIKMLEKECPDCNRI
jgi:hypothetical protein